MLRFTLRSFLGFSLINWFVVTTFSFLGNLTIEAITFDEVSSLARKDPNNNKALIFRQIELNWINAPNEDSNDYIGLYLDDEPDGGSLPVSVHKLNGRLSGQFTTDYYLPQIDFFNETNSLSEESHFGHNNLLAQDYELNNGNNNQYQNQPNHHHSMINRWNSNNNNHLYVPTNKYRRGSSHNQAATAVTNNLDPPSSTTPQLITTNQHQYLSSECLGYCIAYHSRGRILAKNCLRLQPNWMHEMWQFIGARALPTLMLPGTHNSGTFPKQLDKSVLQMINKYQMNQDESIFNQLVYGIRHLDLRVGFSKVKNRQERLWIYHDIFRTDVPLVEVLEQVRRFLDLTSHEIIIMDFHRFTVGFQNESPTIQRERHSKVIELLFDQLGKYIVPSYLGQHAPLQEYINIGKRLIVGYADRSQLIGSQSNEHSIFALYTDKGANQKPVRDIDAIKQDQDEQMMLLLNGSLSKNQPSSKLINDSDGNQAGGQADRRMGTRIYNRLKSLKLISHSFSKRSTTDQQIGNKIAAAAASPSSQNNHLAGGENHSMRLVAQFEEPTKSLALTTADLEPDNSQQLGGGSVSRAALFFSPVRHLWPNKDTLEGLAQYMNDTTCRKYFGELRSMMVELTPTVFGAISDKYDGNRRLAQSVNRQVTDWIRDRWLHCINIVASDYFLGNDLIQLSIYANKMRSLNRNIDLTSKIINNQQQKQCKSFCKIEHLLDKSKIPLQFAYHDLDGSPTPMAEHNELFTRSRQFIQPFGRGSNSLLPLPPPPPTAQTRTNSINDNFITHTSSDGKRILLEPLNYQGPGSGGSPGNSRERRHSFVDNVSEGFSDFFTSFKRLLNL